MKSAPDLYRAITQRKSTRKYEMQPLSAETLTKVEKAITELTPLNASIPLSWHFTQKAKGKFKAEAPHYLIISGSGTPGEMEEAGFRFEQLVLWLDTEGIGSVWLGSTKDAEKSDTESNLITLAFGKTAESLHRTVDEFSRKPIESITNAPEDECMQAVHLAPSGMNSQPWYFEKTANKVLVYQQKLKPPLSFVYKLADLDMGIALCHYALACQQEGRSFTFTRSKTMPDKPGFTPFGIIK